MRQAITMTTTLGDAVATPGDRKDEWLISTPWGDRRFYGNHREAKAELLAIIGSNEDE